MRISLEEAGRRLLHAHKILITAHVHPDGDAIGASLGLMHYLRGQGKETLLFIDDDIPGAFSLLPGADAIGRPDGRDSGADLLVVLDSGIDRIGGVPTCAPAATVLNIDHHVSSEDGAGYLYLDTARAATAEIVYELLVLLHADFTLDIAMPLYTGIATDTGFFRYSNTTPYTMRAGAVLIAAGVQPNLISEAMEAKPYSLVKGMAAAMQTIEITPDGRVAGLFLDQELVATLDSTEGFIDFVRVIEGVDVAVLIKCVGENICRVSMRSKGTDVSAVAMRYGGGGHVRAAGCTLSMPLTEARRTILSALSEVMGERV